MSGSVPTMPLRFSQASFNWANDEEQVLEDLARDGFGYWLSGFIDGEGCFQIMEIKETRTQRMAHHYSCRFCIQLRKDDHQILRTLRDRTGVGKLHYLHRRTHWKDKPNTQTAFRWSTWKKHDQNRLVAILDRFPLRAKKKRDYEIWREAVLTWNVIRQPGPINCQDHLHAKMRNLMEQLRATRRFVDHEEYGSG